MFEFSARRATVVVCIATAVDRDLHSIASTHLSEQLSRFAWVSAVSVSSLSQEFE